MLARALLNGCHSLNKRQRKCLAFQTLVISAGVEISVAI